MSHLCQRPGCGETIPDRYLMCRTDWFRVPMSIRKKVSSTWNNGVGMMTPEYLAARREAIESVRDGQ